MSLRAKPREKNPAMKSDTSQPLQAAVAILGSGRLQGFRQHHHERLEARSFRSPLVQSLGTRKQGEHVDHVVLGLILDLQALLGERTVELVLEELPQVRDGEHFR
jgi:hypothetical protein